MRLTTDVQWPVCCKYPAHKTQRNSCSGDTIDKAGGVQACLPDTDRMIHTMHREWRVHIMDLVTCPANILHCRKQNRLIIKTTNHEFFYRHNTRFMILDLRFK